MCKWAGKTAPLLFFNSGILFDARQIKIGSKKRTVKKNRKKEQKLTEVHKGIRNGLLVA